MEQRVDSTRPRVRFLRGIKRVLEVFELARVILNKFMIYLLGLVAL